MAEKGEVNVKDRSKTGQLSDREKKFIIKLRGKIEQDENNRQVWLRKMATSVNQRLGVKWYPNVPYAGAPDIPLPETDKLIKKSSAPLVLSAWSPKKLALVRVERGVQETPELKGKAQRAQLALNNILRDPKTGWFRKLALAADNRKQYGHCLFRIFEDYRTNIVHREIDLDELEEGVEDQLKAMSKEEKKQFLVQRYNFDLEDDEDKEVVDDILKQFAEGERIISFDMEEVKSMPNVEVPLPTKVSVPTYTTDINTADRIKYELFMSRHEMEEMMDNKTFRTIDLDEVKIDSGAGTADSDVLEQQKSRNEGVADDSTEKDLYRLYMINTWYKPKKSGKFQRWTFVFMADVTAPEEGTLFSSAFPYEFEGWDWEKSDDEIKDARYHDARGVPERIRAYQEVMERAINNMIIRDEMNNTPMWEVQNNSEILDTHQTFGPGTKFPVAQIGTEIARIGEPITADTSSQQILQLIKAFTEEYEGSTDQLFRNDTNAGGGKTKGEVQMGIQQTASISTMDVISFNDTLGRVYYKMFKILGERLDGSIFIEGVEITKEDFNFPAEVISNGNLEISDKNFATQKAFIRLQTIAQYMQAGVVDQEDVFRALQDWLEKDGVKNPDEFSTDPKIILQTQLAQLQQQVQQMMQQLQQGQEVISKQQKTVTRNATKLDKDIDNAEGELTAIEELKQEA